MRKVKIKILGTGCQKCKKLAENAEEAAKELGINYELEKVTDITQIISYGVMITPAIMVGEEVKSSGKVPGKAEITSWLTTEMAKDECNHNP